ncbi:26S proteasome non-ATPase regulatory subunit [Entamoeba marina]
MSQVYFENLCQKYPDYSNQCKTLEEFKSKKLYFQLTGEIEKFVNDPFLRNVGVLAEFYELFVRDVQKKINPIYLSQIVIAVCKEFTNYNQSIQLIESIMVDVESDLGARCLCLSTIGIYHLLLNNITVARERMDTVKQLITHEEGLETFVYSQYHLSGVLYIKFADQSKLEEDERVKFVTNLVICALVGNKVYNFGEFLNNPICESVSNNARATNLIKLLRAINNGNMEEYLRVQQELRDFFESEQSLKQNMNQITEKASIVSLMEMVFRSISEKRTFTFNEISNVTKVPLENVEILIMRALSLGLVKGYISQVQSQATFNWVLPRVLDKNQFAFVSQKLDEWMQMTHKTLEVIEQSKFTLN